MAALRHVGEYLQMIGQGCGMGWTASEVVRQAVGEVWPGGPYHFVGHETRGFR